MKRFIANLLIAALFVASTIELWAKMTGNLQNAKIDAERDAKYLMPDERLGWTNRAGAEGRFLSKQYGYDSLVSFDAMGLRRNGPRPAGNDERRILIVGDSNTVGMEVDDDKTYPAVLEREFLANGKRVRVYNAGVRGYGADQTLLRLKMLLPVLRPDLVLFMASYYGYQQIMVVKNWYRPYSKPAYALVSDRLELMNSPARSMDDDTYVYIDYGGGAPRVVEHLAKPSGISRWLRKRSVVYLWLEDIYYGRINNKAITPPPPDKALQEKIFALLVLEMKKMSPDFMMTCSSRGKEFDPPLYAEMKAIAKKERIPFLDIQPFFQGDGASYEIRGDGHWNESGHRQAGAALYDLLKWKLPK